MQTTTAAHLLSRTGQRRRTAPSVTFAGDLSLERARTHELCGPARRTLALALVRATDGPVIWIRPTWTPDRLNPEGARRFADPARFLFIDVKRPEDLMWSMEEVLRAGLIHLVIADLPGPPGLTAVRRLHLAAETGAAEGQVTPLGLILTPGDGGAPGVETRWACRADHGVGGAEGWRVERRRARMAPPKDWRMTWGQNGPAVTP